MFNTLLIVGAGGSIVVSVFISYKLHTLAVWSACATFTAFLLAACLKWHGRLRWVVFTIFFVAILGGSMKWQTMVWNRKIEQTPDAKLMSMWQTARSSAAGLGAPPPMKESADEESADEKPRRRTSPVKQTAYSRLDDRELKSEVTKLILKINLYLEKKKNQDAKQAEFFKQQMQDAKTEQEKKLVLEAETHHATSQPSIDSEYKERFRSDAVLLRDELLSRLPRDAKKDRRYMYEHPGNTIGMQKIIDDLDMLAKSLPD
jgi:hypothetical protein